jgi:hypothetical protein
MSDEESQSVTVPVPNQASAEENMTTVSPHENPGIWQHIWQHIWQPYDNFVRRALRRRDTWLEERIRRTAPTNSTRKVSDYTSGAFLSLPAPMPVCDVLDVPIWWIIIFRSFERGLLLCIFFLFTLEASLYFLPIIATYLLLRLRWRALPTLSYVAGMLLNINQKFWVRFYP